MHAFTEGGLYFKVSFLDDGLFVPNISSVVYIGKNIEAFMACYEEESDIYFFQDAYSYYNVGAYPNIDVKETIIESFIGNAVGCIHNSDGLIRVLERQK